MIDKEFMVKFLLKNESDRLDFIKLVKNLEKLMTDQAEKKR